MRHVCYAIGAAALFIAAAAVVIGNWSALAPLAVIVLAAAMCGSITGSNS